MLRVRRDVYCGHVGTPKTVESERHVPLASTLVLALQRYLEASVVRSGWLFPNQADTPLRERNLRRRNL